MQVQMEFGIAAWYKSASQRARVVTELWAERNLYCANCESPALTRSRPNAQAIDFACPECRTTFQLKSQASAFSRRIVDAGYEAMRRAIVEDRTPNLIALHYDASSWGVRNLVLVPRFAFSMSVIEKRKPLAPTARRAGWIGCNILLCNIPEDARINLIRDGVPTSPDLVRSEYSRLTPLTRLDVDVRGWTLDVLRVARSLEKRHFSLDELYAHEAELRSLHPANRNVKPKIRQQLQRLRDLGVIEFAGPGHYRFQKPQLTASP
jgi:type II restriction enzyme